MPKTPERDRPEAGADTAQGRKGKGSTEQKGDAGGRRTSAGGTYGDYVPDRGQPRRNDDLDQDPPGAASDQTSGRDPQSDKEAADREERIAEANRNKGFDTPHVHSGTTTRKV